MTRSAPVPGRSNTERRIVAKNSGRARSGGSCCARGRAHSSSLVISHSSFSLHPVHEKQLVTDAFEFFQTQLRCLGNGFDPKAIRRGRSVAPAENERANRLIDLIHEAGAEEAAIDFASARAKQPLDVPL